MKLKTLIESLVCDLCESNKYDEYKDKDPKFNPDDFLDTKKNKVRRRSRRHIQQYGLPGSSPDRNDPSPDEQSEIDRETVHQSKRGLPTTAAKIMGKVKTRGFMGPKMARRYLKGPVARNDMDVKATLSRLKSSKR